MANDSQETAEYEFENFLQDARSDDFEKFSPHKKKQTLNGLRSSRNYLKIHHPDSEMLTLDISDVLKDN